MNLTTIEDQQQQMDVMESELEAKTMLVDTMQQGSVDARQQKQFLEGVVLQADGVIGEMEGTLEQKDGYIGKMSETLANEKRRLRRMGQVSWLYHVTHNGPRSDRLALYHVIRCKTEDMDNAIKKIKSEFPNATIFFRKASCTKPNQHVQSIEGYRNIKIQKKQVHQQS